VKHDLWSQDSSVRSQGRGLSLAQVALRLLPLIVLISACGGGNGSNTPAPILKVGMQRQYAGTVTRAVVYAAPTTAAPNNTLVYKFTETQNVQAASTGAPAPFDVNSVYAYDVVQDPGVGMVPLSQTIDTYENLQYSGDSQTVTAYAQNVVAASNDETSDALGNGPFTATTTTTSTYTTPRDNFAYPLTTGATMTVPQSETQTIKFTDVNASGAAPSNDTDVGYTNTRTQNDDGSYSSQLTYVNGNSFTRTQNSDGSGTEASTTGTSTTTTTVDVPAANGAGTIPITRTVSPANTKTIYTAADWYPDNGNPSSPLILQTRKVVGPASNLPSECAGAVAQSDTDEIDTTTTDLNTMAASYSTTTTRNFSAGNGASVCTLSTETISSYDLLTGLLVSTTTTTTTTTLSEINY
jgi:hypothetical protein